MMNDKSDVRKHFGSRLFSFLKCFKIKINPKGQNTGYKPIIRGGNWVDNSRYCRVACRIVNDKSDVRKYLGFRIAFSPARINKCK